MKILILAGLTCAGKDTIQNIILERKENTKAVVSTTSRPMRPGEINGVNYFFTHREMFENLIQKDKLVEYREYHTLMNNEPDIWYYGIEKKAIDNKFDGTYVCVVDPIGFHALQKEYGKENVHLIWVETKKHVRKKRNKARGDFDKFEFKRRTVADNKTFAGMKNEAEYIIKNNGSYRKLIEKVDAVLKHFSI